jgi:AraC family transcriptional regulator
MAEAARSLQAAVPTAHRDAGPPPAVRTAYERAWDGLRVMEVHAGAREVPEQVLASTVVSLNLGAPFACESTVDGGRWERHQTPHHGVSVYPSSARIAGRSLGPTSQVVLEISPGFLSTAAAAAAPGAPPLRTSIGARDPFVAHVLLALAAEAGSPAGGGSMAAEALGAVLVAHLFGGAPGAHRTTAALGGARLRRVVEHVCEHLGGPLSLRALAGVAGMDVFRFVRAFKQATGLPPHRYVLLARIERAKALLADPELTISDVALRAGFATPSHFSTVFRRVTSATPRDYRAALH